MSAPGREPTQVKGVTGTVAFDGSTVAIMRTGFLARTTIGKGEKRIPVRQITAVQFKPAGLLVNGFIQFSLGGGVESQSQFGHQTMRAVQDENSVVFTRQQQQGFEWLRDAIEHAVHANPIGYAPTPTGYAPTPSSPGHGVDPVAQLHQLADLHRAGALSDAEFDGAKRTILGRLR